MANYKGQIRKCPVEGCNNPLPRNKKGVVIAGRCNDCFKADKTSPSLPEGQIRSDESQYVAPKEMTKNYITKHPDVRANLISKLLKKAEDDSDINGSTGKVLDVALTFGETSENSKRGLPNKKASPQHTDKEIRQQKHIQESEEKSGKSKDEAESIGWATVNKQKHEASSKDILKKVLAYGVQVGPGSGGNYNMGLPINSVSPGYRPTQSNRNNQAPKKKVNPSPEPTQMGLDFQPEQMGLFDQPAPTPAKQPNIRYKGKFTPFSDIKTENDAANWGNYVKSKNPQPTGEPSQMELGLNSEPTQLNLGLNTPKPPPQPQQEMVQEKKPSKVDKFVDWMKNLYKKHIEGPSENLNNIIDKGKQRASDKLKELMNTNYPVSEGRYRKKQNQIIQDTPYRASEEVIRLVKTAFQENPKAQRIEDKVERGRSGDTTKGLKYFEGPKRTTVKKPKKVQDVKDMISTALLHDDDFNRIAIALNEIGYSPKVILTALAGTTLQEIVTPNNPNREFNNTWNAQEGLKTLLTPNKGDSFKCNNCGSENRAIHYKNCTGN